MQYADIPDPGIGLDDVLIRVQACGAHAGEVVPLDLIPLFRNGWRIVGFRLAPPGDLAASLELIRRGAVKVPIAATFPVSDAAEAHRFLERRQHVGKVLLVAV